MTKQQTFVICLKDKQGELIDFHRLSCEKLSTCIKKMVLAYKEAKDLLYIQNDLKLMTEVVIYETDCNENENKVLTISQVEFMTMIA